MSTLEEIGFELVVLIVLLLFRILVPNIREHVYRR